MDGGFLVNLDSVAQRESHDRNPERSVEELTGVLRVGCLLTGTLLFTDTQVLDGILMLEIGPRGVQSRIGEAFVILARGPSLELSLAEFFDRGSATLAQFELSSLPDMNPEQRIEVGRRLTLYPSSEFRRVQQESGVVAAVCTALRASGVQNHHIERLAVHWQSWIDADRNGQLRIVQRPYGQLNMAEQAAKKPLTSVLRDSSHSAAIEQISAAINQSARRSEIRFLIGQLNLNDDDVISVREWLDTVYVCAIARHYGVLAVDLPRSSVERLAQRRSSEEAEVMLSLQSVQRLSNVRTATFEIIYDRTRDDARNWLETKKERHIRQLASTIDRDTATDSNLRRDGLKSAVRLAFVAAVVQVSSAFDHRLSIKIVLALGAVLLTELIPVAYRFLFPKGQLAATIDPMSK